MVRSTSVVALLALTCTLQLTAQAPPSRPGAPPQVSARLARIRAALDKYRDPIMAVHDGYFSTVACVEYPEAGGAGRMRYPPGGMGVHFLNVGLIGPQIDSLRPQVLIYEKDRDSLRLVAAEWFVPVAAQPNRPEIFGVPFEGPMEGHHPVQPVGLHHWDLHVWLWKPNPGGVFTATNANVHCPSGGYSFKEQAPRVAVGP